MRTPIPQLSVSGSLALLVVALAGGAWGRGATVPFVGCGEMDEGLYTDPPTGGDMLVDLDSGTARQIAYYKGKWTPGVFAPRGWHCLGGSGSSRERLVVSLDAIDSTDLPRLTGSAIEADRWFGGTSGRLEVAIVSSRLFPRIAASFVDQVKREGLVPDSDFERNPGVRDTVSFPSAVIARVVTPERTDGFGTEQSLLPAGAPIHSIVVLDTLSDWDLEVLRMRLETASHLEGVLLRLNQACMTQAACFGGPP